jgi:hypothetical protein
MAAPQLFYLLLLHLLSFGWYTLWVFQSRTLGFLEFRLLCIVGVGVFLASRSLLLFGATLVSSVVWVFLIHWLISHEWQGRVTAGKGYGREGLRRGRVTAGKGWGRGVSGVFCVWSHVCTSDCGRYLGFFENMNHLLLLGFHKELSRYVIHLVKYLEILTSTSSQKQDPGAGPYIVGIPAPSTTSKA